MSPYLVDEIIDRNGNVVFKSPRVAACSNCGNTTSSTKKSSEIESQDFTEADSLDALLEQELLVEKTKETIQADRIMDARVVYIIDSILKDAIQKGTARKARGLGRKDLAGKTGTTNGPTDAWFSGYHPDLVVTTWLGFDSNKNIGTREYGGSAALPIWIDFMRENLNHLEKTAAVRPSGMVSVKIDSRTGLAANDSSINTRFELFLEEHSPQQSSAIRRSTKHKETQLNEELF
jgi:penicillin-binding protein 1A